MSEYQYYEFQAIDRPLTASEQGTIKALSSRVQLSSTQAVFVYNYGDFRGNPEEILAKYFDAMLYVANWGTWQIMFRLPKQLVNPQWFQPYELENTLTVSTRGEFVILDIVINEEDGASGWMEGDGWMSRLLPLREQLLQGDLRLLYLVWLRTADHLAEYVLEEDPIEPPVPPNLGQLTDSLQAFIEWVELDPDCVTVAAQASPTQAEIAPPPLETYLPQLSDDEKQSFLLKLIQREPHVDLQLIQRLQSLAGSNQAQPVTVPGQRRLSELVEQAQAIALTREQQELQAFQAKRQRELQALAPKEAQLWQRVKDLIALKQAKPYDEAAALLQDLCELADYQGRSPQFHQRLEQLKAEYRNRPSLIARLQQIRE